jgi:hypothetical protein
VIEQKYTIIGSSGIHWYDNVQILADGDEFLCVYALVVRVPGSYVNILDYFNAGYIIFT